MYNSFYCPIIRVISHSIVLQSGTYPFELGDEAAVCLFLPFLIVLGDYYCFYPIMTGIKQFIIAMNAGLKLFSRTFQKINLLQATNQSLKGKLPQITELQQQHAIAHLFHMSYMFTKQASQLQDPSVCAILEHFLGRYDTLAYNYDHNQFQLTKTKQKLNLKYEVRNMVLEAYDHPMIRKSLYFHQLKDAHKYFQQAGDVKMPSFMKELEKIKFERDALDKKNPLGVPIWESTLQIKLIAERKPRRKCEFNISSYLGDINIKTSSNFPSGRKYTVDFFRKDERLQERVYNFIELNAGLTEQEYFKLRLLAYVGGRIQKLELMYNTYQLIAGGFVQ